MKNYGCLTFFLILMLSACTSDETLTPEAQIKNWVNEVERGVEKKDIKAIRQLIVGTYKDKQNNDKQNNDKQKIISLFRYQFIKNHSIHLFTHIKEIKISDKTKATLGVLVIMTGKPMDSQKVHERLKGDFYRFDIKLENEFDQWRAVSAQWKKSAADDFTINQ